MIPGMELPSQTILVGIDEAGYGPLLGPLVVSATAFEAPTEATCGSLWSVLKQSVTKKPCSHGRRIEIRDSKKIYQRSEGLGRLERSVLAVLTAWRGDLTNLYGLLSAVAPDVIPRLGLHPWYGEGRLDLPLQSDAADIRIAAGTLRRDMEARSIKMIGCWSEVLLEQDFNQQVQRTNNKAAVLLNLVLRLMYRIAQAHPGQNIHFRIDKQGGRDQYGHPLRTAFETRYLKIVEEREDYSAYELDHGSTQWSVSFTQGGEEAHLPIALASMVSKYVRELFMDRFNAYWLAQAPGLRPTAGYYNDGQRFLKDIKAHLPRLGIAHDCIARMR